MKALPKISVVIPSLNKEKYISQTLESILSQKYPYLEVLIQDGGSEDGTLRIIKRYAKKYPKIIRWKSEKDKGQVDAINKGLKIAKGEIVTYLNADDLYKKGALLAVGKCFLSNPRALWLAGKGETVNKKGKKFAPWVTAYKNYLLKQNNYQLLLMVNYLMQPSVFLKRKAYEKFGPFKGFKIGVMEYALWLKLGKVQMPYILDRYLSSFRMSGENISSTQFRETLKEDEMIVGKYTDNPIILVLHFLHNIARILIWLG